jgi:hypothetical protein
MRHSSLGLSRRRWAAIFIGGGVLAIAACSGLNTGSWLGAGASSTQASREVRSRSNPLAVTYSSFWKVYDNNGTQNEANSFNDDNWVVGTYMAGGQKNSFDEPCASYPCGTPVSADYDNKLGNSVGTYLNGSNNSNGDHIDDVGYVKFSSPPTGYTCTTCGAVYDFDDRSGTGTWDLIEDPNDSSCGVTELTGINGSDTAVGYYKVKISGVCVEKAFEEYQYNNATVFVPFNVTGTTSTTNVIATGINNYGDVVGTATPVSGVCTGSVTVGWYYTDFGYQTFCVGGSSNTQALSLNDNDGIVGSYDDSLGTHGFLISGSITSKPNFTPIVVKIGTVSYSSTTVNSLNTAWTISGQYDDGHGNSYGFLGFCNPCPKPNAPRPPRGDGASRGPRP